MSKGIKYLFAIAIGAAAGSFATWKLLEAKYQKIADEEIASMKDYYERRYTESTEESKDKNPETEDEKDDSECFVYEDKVSEYITTTESNEDEKGGSEVAEEKSPYVITPGEFGDGEYELETLLYFEKDRILTDDGYTPIGKPESIVGPDFASHFGDYDYDQDSVYVRNDRLKTDYEILRDERKYDDVVKQNPNLTDEE